MCYEGGYLQCSFFHDLYKGLQAHSPSSSSRTPAVVSLSPCRMPQAPLTTAGQWLAPPTIQGGGELIQTSPKSQRKPHVSVTFLGATSKRSKKLAKLI